MAIARECDNSDRCNDPILLEPHQQHQLSTVVPVFIDALLWECERHWNGSTTRDTTFPHDDFIALARPLLAQPDLPSARSLLARADAREDLWSRMRDLVDEASSTTYSIADCAAMRSAALCTMDHMLYDTHSFVFRAARATFTAPCEIRLTEGARCGEICGKMSVDAYACTYHYDTDCVVSVPENVVQWETIPCV